MNKVISIMPLDDYNRLKMLAQAPAQDEEYTGFKTLMTVANKQETAQLVVLMWNNIDWKNTKGTRFIEGFLTFCPQYRFVNISLDTSELIQDASGCANDEKMDNSIKIVIDVKVQI